MPRVNGDDVELHYGDQVVPLSDRLAGQDKKIARLERLLAVIGLILIVHAVAPDLDLFQTLLQLIGL